MAHFGTILASLWRHFGSSFCCHVDILGSFFWCFLTVFEPSLPIFQMFLTVILRLFFGRCFGTMNAKLSKIVQEHAKTMQISAKIMQNCAKTEVSGPSPLGSYQRAFGCRDPRPRRTQCPCGGEDRARVSGSAGRTRTLGHSRQWGSSAF